MTPEGLHRLKEDEGLRLKPYHDSVGVLTIGYGRNLEASGISDDEALVMLTNDIALCEVTIEGFWPALHPVRKDVLANMIYNLGVGNFMSFKHLIHALASQDWETAAKEILNSSAARELPERYGRLAEAMRGACW